MDGESGPSDKDIGWKAPDISKTSDSPNEETKPFERKEGEPPTIADAQNLDELKEAVREVGSLEGSRRSYTSQELLDVIDQVWSGDAMLQSLTRSGGLRDKAEELLNKESESG